MTEDVVTAAFFDHLRIWRATSLLRAMLGQAHRHGRCLSLPEFDAFDVELWPSAHRAGEPDVSLILRHGDAVVARGLVEAKLGAAKSGEGEIVDDGAHGDQLARYLVAEAEDWTGVPVFLLYLTHHGACPRDELAESEHWLLQKQRPDLVERLVWLSWRDAETLLRRAPPTPGTVDLSKLLTAVAMFRFGGVVLHRLGPLGTPTYYAGASIRDKHRGYPSAHPSLGQFGDWSWKYTRPYLWPSREGSIGSAEFYARREQ